MQPQDSEAQKLEQLEIQAQYHDENPDGSECSWFVLRCSILIQVDYDFSNLPLSSQHRSPIVFLGPKVPHQHKHKDPTNHGFWNPLVLSLVAL